MIQTTIRQLASRYDALLFDAYGVLIRSDGPVEGAVELIRKLTADGHALYVLTNDASRSIAAAGARYRELGLPIQDDQVITSGSLLTRYFAENDLVGARTICLGTPDSHTYALEAGGELVGFDEEPPDDLGVLVVADLPSEDLRERSEFALSALMRTIDAGGSPTLVLPNPDLVFPRTATTYGMTGGALAATYEAILAECYHNRAFSFERLGKPHPYIYEQGAVLAGVPRDAMVMIGDQLQTDVLGAIDFGIDAALVATGLTSVANVDQDWPVKPTYQLGSLEG